MELGIYSFGDVQLDTNTGECGSGAQAMRNLVEAIQVADEVGLDFFGIGEHHTREMPASAGTVVLGAAAATTKNIRLGSAATVLSTDDPVRVFQQFATVDALSHGRAEIVAGRGSSIESFPLFGFDLDDYDALFEEKLALLREINDLAPEQNLSWKGKYRPAINNAAIVPHPEADQMLIWRATGGSPNSSYQAGIEGIPVIYAIIGGRAERFGQLADLYRAGAQQAGKSGPDIKVAVSAPGFIAPNTIEAKNTWWDYYHRAWSDIGKLRGWPEPDRQTYDWTVKPGGALYVGSPEEIAERIVDLHGAMGHMRHILQMDLGSLPQREFLRSIELLGTEVKPLVDAALGTATS